jgi:hypothetical protein
MKICCLLVIGVEEGKLLLVPRLQEGSLCLAVPLGLPHSRICPTCENKEGLGVPSNFKFTEKHLVLCVNKYFNIIQCKIIIA